MKRVVAVIIISLLMMLAGCTGSVNTIVKPNTDLKKYKTAYVDMLMKDEFNLGAAIMAHMTGMGFVVKQAPVPSDATEADLLVKYDYCDGWDMRRYMKNFSISVFDAKTNALLLNSRYALTGIWRGEEFRINYTFNDIRINTGYSPLPDFE